VPFELALRRMVALGARRLAAPRHCLTPAACRRLRAAPRSPAVCTATGPVYVTTPIYYVNDRPHIGHAYTSTVADVFARAARASGREVLFLTGTDEHGLKVEQSAAKRGVTPQALADENSAAFRGVMEQLGVSFDVFLRTTSPAHTRQVQALVARLQAAGDVYLGTFEGWYDAGQEEARAAPPRGPRCAHPARSTTRRPRRGSWSTSRR